MSTPDNENTESTAREESGEGTERETTYRFGIGVIEKRAITYIINELDAGRQLFDILKDPYIKNRIEDSKIKQLLAEPDLLDAFRDEIDKVREGLQ